MKQCTGIPAATNKIVHIHLKLFQAYANSTDSQRMQNNTVIWINHIQFANSVLENQGLHDSKVLCTCWRPRCLLRWSARANLLSQTVHANDLIPVCFRLCRANLSDRANVHLHDGKVQRNGFSPVWLRECAFKWYSREYHLPQPGCGHWKGFSPRWVRMCASKWCFLEHRFVQPEMKAWANWMSNLRVKTAKKHQLLRPASVYRYRIVHRNVRKVCYFSTNLSSFFYIKLSNFSKKNPGGFPRFIRCHKWKSLN